MNLKDILHIFESLDKIIKNLEKKPSAKEKHSGIGYNGL